MLNNKFHGGHHSLLFDQGFQIIAGRDLSERHLMVIRMPSDGICIDEIVPSYVVVQLNCVAYRLKDFSVLTGVTSELDN